MANFKSPTQTIISSPVVELNRAGPLLEAAGSRMCAPLPVSAAFHSLYMEASAQVFDEFLSGEAFKPLKLPVIANVTGRPYPAGDPTATIRSTLVKQMSNPVQWSQCVRYLSELGATAFQEIGPGVVLSRQLKQILPTP